MSFDSLYWQAAHINKQFLILLTYNSRIAILIKKEVNHVKEDV
jgi:hypothetical protein